MKTDLLANIGHNLVIGKMSKGLTDNSYVPDWFLGMQLCSAQTISSPAFGSRYIESYVVSLIAGKLLLCMCVRSNHFSFPG